MSVSLRSAVTVTSRGTVPGVPFNSGVPCVSPSATLTSTPMDGFLYLRPSTRPFSILGTGKDGLEGTTTTVCADVNRAKLRKARANLCMVSIMFRRNCRSWAFPLRTQTRPALRPPPIVNVEFKSRIRRKDFSNLAQPFGHRRRRQQGIVALAQIVVVDVEIERKQVDRNRIREA